MARTRPPSGRDYEVGYAKPPKPTRFAPGQSGNPRGRPKGARTLGVMLQDALRKKIDVIESGNTRKLSILAVILRRLANDAMRGDVRAIKIWLSLAERYATAEQAETGPSDIAAEDLAILAQFLPEAPNVGADIRSKDTKREPDVGAKG